MKTLLITSEYPPFKGGVANFYDNIVSRWPEKDKIFVLVDGVLAEEHESEPEINVLRQKMQYSWIWPHWLPAIYFSFREIAQKKINHIIVGQLLPFGSVIWLISFILKIEYTVIIHGMELPLAFRSARKKFLAKKILARAKYVICPNNYAATMVRVNVSDPQKVSVVNPGVDTNFKCNAAQTLKFREQMNLVGKTVMLSLHRLVKRKGADMTLEALSQINELFPDLVYVIVGDGPDKPLLKELASKYNNVIFFEKISDEDKWNWFCACDIFIMPSRDIDGDFEGFGIVYLEANLAGKAIVAGDSGGVREAVIHELNGLLVNPTDKNSIADAVIRLCKDPQLRFRLGEQGRARVLKDFDWSGQVKKIYNIIK